MCAVRTNQLGVGITPAAVGYPIEHTNNIECTYVRRPHKSVGRRNSTYSRGLSHRADI